MDNISRKKSDRAVFLTKCILVILGLLPAFPGVDLVVREIYKVSCVWGFILVLYLFVKDRKNLWTKEYLLLFLFCCSYVVTILLNFSNHFVNEVAMVGYTGVLLFVLTYYDKRKSREETLKEIRVLAWIVTIGTFIIAAIGLLMFIFSVGGGIEKNDGGMFIYGMYENRLYGLYNPNTGSVFHYISIIFSSLLLKYTITKRKFLWCNIVMQVLCFILTQSRGGWVCAIAYVVIYMFFIRKWHKNFTNIFKQWLYRIVVTTALCILIGGASNLVKVGISYVPGGVESLLYSDDELKDVEKKKNDKLKRLDEKEHNLESMSTGRTAMWKIGLKAYKEAPVFGIGYRSIDDALKQNMTKAGYMNSRGGSLHNIYITILISCGAVGFVILALFILLVLKRMVIVVKDKRCPEFDKYVYALVVVWLIGDLFESRLILGMNFLAFLFWITLGYSMYFLKKGEKDGQHNSSSI